KLVDSISGLNYYTSREIVVPVPHINQEIVINWGFSGSEDIFSPLPHIPVQLRPLSTEPGSASSNFSIKDLGAALAQDALSEQLKQVPFLTWITQTQLTPLKLFYLKLFLLVQTYHHRYVINPLFLGSEIIRLLIKLSLAEMPGTDARPLSQQMPSSIRNAINQMMPHVIELIDILWRGLTDKKLTLKQAHISKLNPRAVYAVSMQREEDAENYLKSLQKQQKPQDFITSNGITRFTSMGLAQASSQIPQELNEAAQKLTTFPQFIKASAQNRHWVALVTDQLDISDSTQIIALTMARTIAEYATLHTAYLKNNPEAARKHHEQCAADTKRQLKLQAFLQSKIGKESLARIEQELNQIEQEISGSANQQIIQKLEAQLQAHNARKQELLTASVQAKNQCDIYQNALNNLEPGHDGTIVRQRYERAHQEYMARQQELAQLETLRTNTITEIQSAGGINPEITAEIVQLRAMADEFQESGETIPSALTEKIAKLEAHKEALKPSSEKIDAQRANVYKQELVVLKNKLTEEHDLIEVLPAEQQKLARMRYELIQQQYEIYCADIQRKISLIENTASNKDSIITTMQELGFAISGTEFQEMLRDFNEENKLYTPLKQQLFDTLEFIAHRSAHIHKFSRSFRYLIARYLPGFLQAFDRATQA
ncbi:MAG: hypothetical protein WC365_05610, partial [Candidatus Babeliales bacterium]